MGKREIARGKKACQKLLLWWVVKFVLLLKSDQIHKWNLQTSYLQINLGHTAYETTGFVNIG